MVTVKVKVVVVMVVVMVMVLGLVVVMVVKVANMGDTRTIHHCHIIYTTILHQSYNQCHHICNLYRIHIVALERDRFLFPYIVFHKVAVVVAPMKLFLLYNYIYP